MTEQSIYTPLIDAPVNSKLELIKISGKSLRQWLHHLGLFKGSTILRHGEELQYHPVRVRGISGDVVVPAGFAIKTIVHLDGSDKRCPLTEMPKKSSGHIETISGGPGVRDGLKKLGLMEEQAIYFIRTLPHMDYVTVINSRQRTRLSEGEAAKIWGKYTAREDKSEGQFYFSRKGEEFIVETLLGGQRSKAHLASHGVREGDRLYMETVERTQEVHSPIASPVVISGSGGLRFYLAPEQAAKIMVKVA